MFCTMLGCLSFPGSSLTKALFLVVSGNCLGSRIHLGQACLHRCWSCHLLPGSEPIEPFSWKWLLLLEDLKVSLNSQSLAPLHLSLYSVSVTSLLQMHLHPAVWLCWDSQAHSTKGAGKRDDSSLQNYPLPRPMPVLGSGLEACRALGGPSFQAALPSVMQKP